jgi:hypothetical protein
MKIPSIYTIYTIALMSIFIYCSSQSNNQQIQTLIESNLNHTHDIIITLDDLKNNREDYYTSENYQHRHKVILTIEDRQKLLNGLKIVKETEEAYGHTHKLEIQAFSF